MEAVVCLLLVVYLCGEYIEVVKDITICQFRSL